MLENEISSKLLSYQTSHAENLIQALKSHKRAIDASDTGTGKTYTAVAVAKHLGLKPLIICPKSVIHSWIDVLKHFDYVDKCYGISNYELIKNCRVLSVPTLTKAESHFIKPLKPVITTKTGGKKTICSYSWDLPNDCLLIFDEVHRCKNFNTRNAQLILSLHSQQTVNVLIVSATICDTPEKFRNFGYLLGFYDVLRKYPFWLSKIGTNFANPMMGVKKYIYPEYASRMKISMLGDLFPKNQVIAKAYDMDSAKEIQEMYDLIKEAQEDLKDKEKKAEGLAKLVRARQRIENLKLPTLIELAKGFLAEGCAVAIFVNYTDSLRTLGDALKTKNFIFGEQTVEERVSNIERFNSDKEHIIIANLQSGGVGISLHDTHGKYPRVSIISPSWNATDTLQAIGRVFRAKTKTPVRQRIVYCSETVEDMVCRTIKDKINNIGFLNDGSNENYLIEGLTKEKDIVVGEDDQMSELQRIQLKLETLTIKKKRLLKEINDTDEEIKSLRFIMSSYGHELRISERNTRGL